jgi:hypothetical protein
MSAPDRPYLRGASPAVMDVIGQLRGGEITAPQLPVDPDGPYADVLRYWAVEVQQARWWAQDVRRGTRRRPSPIVAAWCDATRQRYAVDDAWEACAA